MKNPPLITILPFLLLLPLPGCGEEADLPEAPAFLSLPERPVPGRVFLVGLDGASWQVFDDILAAGTMPRLSEVVERGARTVLESMDPTASAIVWTTIATGKLPKKHGILGFTSTTDDGEVVPVSSTLRKVRALWNICSEAGVSVGFLSWWVTWPAEPVRGFMATDYAWPLKKDARGFATGTETDPGREHRTWPASLMAELDPLNRTEASVEPAELERLRISSIPKAKGYAVRDILLKDVSVGAMSRHMLDRNGGESLFAVYFDGFDAYCHLFWPIYSEVARARKAGPQALAAVHPGKVRIAEALDAHLGRIDSYLGDLLDRMGKDDVMLIVSDHGYGDNPGRAEIERTYGELIQPDHWHTKQGILAAVGAPIRAGAPAIEASVLDITPTVLALLGLPVAKDMDGRPLEDLLDPEFLERHPIQWIDTYDRTPREGAASQSPYDEAMLDRLEQLGYLDR